MQFDMRTIVFFTTIFCLMFGISMLVFNNRKSPFSGVSHMGAGLILNAIGFLLMFLRDFIDPFLSVVISNSAILFGVILIFRGLVRFYEKRMYSMFFDLFGLALFSASFVYYLYFKPDINMRVIIICVYLIYYYMLSFYVIVHKPKYNILSAKWFIGGYLVFNSLFYVFRIVWTINEPQMPTFMQAGLVHNLGIITFSLLALVISYGVFIIMNRVINDELAQQVYVDSLTGIYNRRAISEIIPKELTKADQLSKKNSYVLCDIDFFKKVNDTYGHDAGDFVLKEIAEILNQNTRITDTVSRYGGEEFMIFFPQTGQDEALFICNKLRKLIEAHDFVHNEDVIKITMSFGIFTAEDEKIAWGDCVNLADKALYTAKENGRNRCEIAKA